MFGHVVRDIGSMLARGLVLMLFRGCVIFKSIQICGGLTVCMIQELPSFDGVMSGSSKSWCQSMCWAYLQFPSQ
jgi:hypothetical protein